MRVTVTRKRIEVSQFGFQVSSFRLSSLCNSSHSRVCSVQTEFKRRASFSWKRRPSQGLCNYNTVSRSSHVKTVILAVKGKEATDGTCYTYCKCSSPQEEEKVVVSVVLDKRHSLSHHVPFLRGRVMKVCCYKSTSQSRRTKWRRVSWYLTREANCWRTVQSESVTSRVCKTRRCVVPDVQELSWKGVKWALGWCLPASLSQSMTVTTQGKRKTKLKRPSSSRESWGFMLATVKQEKESCSVCLSLKTTVKALGFHESRQDSAKVTALKTMQVSLHVKMVRQEEVMLLNQHKNVFSKTEQLQKKRERRTFQLKKSSGFRDLKRFLYHEGQTPKVSLAWRGCLTEEEG